VVVGKRSEFTKRPQDKYFTPYAGVVPLLPYLPEGTAFAEPCAGDGRLIKHLRKHGHYCSFSCDLEPNDENIPILNALELVDEHLRFADMIITNPPWSRPILHSLIEYLPTLKPTWLLFDADWMHTRQSGHLIKGCEKIVSIGRLKWIEGSPSVGKDNCCWYYFPGNYTDGPKFHGRIGK
jgi:hypothetical protein